MLKGPLCRYFHRAPTKAEAGKGSTVTGGYRGGTRKGLDLTLGSGPLPQTTIDTATTSHYFSYAHKDDGSMPELQKTSSPTDPPDTHILRGGALLRTFRRISTSSDDGRVISGPSLLVDEILRLSGASNIAELVHTKWSDDTSAFPPSSLCPSSPSRPFSLYLIKKPLPPTVSVPQKRMKMYCSPRIGLDLSHRSITLENARTHPRTTYVSRPYRFFTQPHLLTANGRAHTFLGVYRSCVEDMRPNNVLGLSTDGDLGEALCAQVAQLTGLKPSVAAKYVEVLNAGIDQGALSAFIGSKGKGAGSSPALFLRMIGTLQRLKAATTTPSSSLSSQPHEREE